MHDGVQTICRKPNRRMRRSLYVYSMKRGKKTRWCRFHAFRMEAEKDRGYIRRAVRRWIYKSPEDPGKHSVVVMKRKRVHTGELE